jgi:hypothetical protein
MNACSPASPGHRQGSRDHHFFDWGLTQERLASLRSITMIALSRYVTPQDCSSFLQAIIPFSPPLPLLVTAHCEVMLLVSQRSKLSGFAALNHCIVTARQLLEFRPRGPSDSDRDLPLLSSPLLGNVAWSAA